MFLRSVTVDLAADEIRRALLSLNLERIVIHDVDLGPGRIDVSIRTDTPIPVPARLRLELAGFSGTAVRFRARFPPFLGASTGHVLHGIGKFPGFQTSGQDSLELDIAALSRGAVESLNLRDVQIAPDGITLSASDLKLRTDWSDVFAS